MTVVGEPTATPSAREGGRAAPAGMTLRDRYSATTGTVAMTGVQALVRLPLDQHRADHGAGRRTGAYVSGYEGSPLAGYDLELARHRDLLDAHDVHHAPGLNEELALTAVAGTQLAAGTGALTCDGVVGYWYGKAPGLDRATDALRHANLTGTHHLGGALALVGDDPGAKSSTVPSASGPALADMALPVLAPADVQDVLDLGRHGVALSRASGLWVAMTITTAVADGSGTVDVDPTRVTPVEPDRGGWTHRPTAHLLGAGLATIERELHTIRLEAARRYAAANGLDRVLGEGPARVGIVAAGPAWFDVAGALAQLGLGLDAAGAAERARRGVRLMRVGMPWPLEPGVVDRFADGLDEIVVVEEKRAFLETQVKDRLYGRPGAPAVHGKTGPDGSALFAPHGVLDPDRVAAGLAGRLLAHEPSGGFPSVRAWRERGRARRIPLSLTPVGRSGSSSAALGLPERTPYFCSGCPHSTSTTSAPEGSLVGAGIGCHTMVLLMPESQVGEATGLTQMGGEGAHWLGMTPFLDAASAGHWVQNMGDGTFHHSGSLAVRAAVAAGAHMTFRLLHNGAAAMTGGQDAVGALSVPALTRLLAAEGVARTIVTTDDRSRYASRGLRASRSSRLAPGVEVWDRSRIDEAGRVLAATEGVTVLIHDQECAAAKRRRRTRDASARPTTRVMINERVCEGCGDCGRTSNCLSVTPVDTEFGRKTRIHQGSCNVDLSCLDGDCPAFVTVTTPATARERASGAGAPAPLAADALPEPAGVLRDPDAVTVRLAGIGGTGVTTASQVLAAAARLAGRHVRGLDQTGLAQKGGAVVSDLTITAVPVARASRASAGECDLYLGADLLVAAEPATLAVADPGRTVAVVSRTRVPTGAMVVDPAATFPDVDAVVARVRERARDDAGAVLDARALAEALFGEGSGERFALTLLLGAAYQCGALPLPASAIEEAFALNGTAVERNVQAFRRGRQSVADPEAFAAVTARAAPEPAVPGLGERGRRRAAALVAELLARAGAPAGGELARLVDVRVPELVAYQDERYARTYVDAVVAVAAHGELAEAVAVGLHRLMAYKDEYEVARLALDPAFDREVRAQFGDDARYAWKLHPPVLRAAGLRHKLTLGAWFRPAFVGLRGARRLRGTVLDPFGRAEVRRIERALVAEYLALIPRLAACADRARAVEVARLPDLVRGYEQIKLDHVARYRARLAELAADLPAATT